MPHHEPSAWHEVGVPVAEGHDRCVYQYATDPRVALHYDAYYGLQDLFIADSAFVLEQFPGPARILDVGCGTGRHVVLLTSAGHDVTGVDISPAMLTVAQRKLTDQNLSAHLIQGDVCRLEGVADESFDGVLCMFSLLGLLRGERLRVAALREAGRVLRPGGRLLLHVHARHHLLTAGWPGIRCWLRMHVWPWLHGLETGDQRIEEYRNLLDLYLHAFSRREILGLARRCSLQVTSFYGVATDGRNHARIMRSGWPELRAHGFFISLQKPFRKPILHRANRRI